MTISLAICALLYWEPIGGIFNEVEVMHTAQLALAKSGSLHLDQASAPQKVESWIARFFGCWHREMSRPFSQHGQAYRVCLNCGAHRKFNLANWEMQGNFYYDRPSTHLRPALHLVGRAN